MGRPKKTVAEEIEPQGPPIITEKISTAVSQATGDSAESTQTDDYNVEVIRDYYGAVDIFYLNNKDPNYAYRWLYEETTSLAVKTTNLLFDKGGWQLCPKKHLVSKLKIADKYISADGFHRRGQAILAFMPKKLYEEKEAYKKGKAEAPIQRIQRFMKDGDKTVGGKDIHETMKGIQPAHKLGMGSEKD